MAESSLTHLIGRQDKYQWWWRWFWWWWWWWWLWWWWWWHTAPGTTSTRRRRREGRALSAETSGKCLESEFFVKCQTLSTDKKEKKQFSAQNCQNCQQILPNLARHKEIKILKKFPQNTVISGHLTLSGLKFSKKNKGKLTFGSKLIHQCWLSNLLFLKVIVSVKVSVNRAFYSYFIARLEFHQPYDILHITEINIWRPEVGFTK